MRRLRVDWILYLGIICFLATTGNAQQRVVNRVCDTIHYEFMDDKIIIPVTVNGKKVKYIVDTGGKTGTVHDSAVEMSAKLTGTSTGILDLNLREKVFQTAIIEDIMLSPNYKIAHLETMLLPANGFFKRLGVAGILGGDAFAESVITFDARARLMVINYPYRPGGLKVDEGVKMYPGNNWHAVVRVTIGGEERPVLFDTGAQGFLLFSSGDYKALAGKGGYDTRAVGHGINGMGISGMGEPVELNKVNVHELTFLGKRFVHVGSITTPMDMSIIGVEMLNYGKVIIDYMRERFYFFPYEEGTVDMGGAPKTWNVGVLPVKDHFEVTTIWQSMEGKVAFGDRVLNINGTDMSNIELSEIEVEKVFAGISGEDAYLVVLREGKEQKIWIRKE